MNSKVGRLETSVYRALNANSREIWAICSMHVDPAGRIMKARATCSAEVILSEGLLFEADGTPHPRHANVVNWPDAKHARKNIQQKIAAAMALEMREEGEAQA